MRLGPEAAMRRHTVGLLFMTMAGVTGGILLASQKPVVTIPIRVEPRGAVATFEELWAGSTLVVDGVVEAERPADREVAGILDVRTTYVVRVTEVFKGSGVLKGQPTIPVRRRGGIRDRGERVEHHSPVNYPLFKAGERYILFLRQQEWSAATPEPGIYYNETTYGPDSVFQVTAESRLQTPGRSRLSQALAAQDAEALRKALRRAGKSQ